MCWRLVVHIETGFLTHAQFYEGARLKRKMYMHMYCISLHLHVDSFNRDIFYRSANRTLTHVTGSVFTPVVLAVHVTAVEVDERRAV